MPPMASNNPQSTIVLGTENAPGWQSLPPEYAVPLSPPSLAEARQYCERLARSHYENFSVATWFLPRKYRQHFYNVYAYCRISDDLGDEVGDPQQALQLLDIWEGELNACYEGQPHHPVFVALAETVRTCDIPKSSFADLLEAFRHLVLYVCGYRDAERQRLSDVTCTALQLANFWQDVVLDYGKGRIYLPLEDLRRFGVPESDIAERRTTPEFLELMRFQVARARDWFARGMPLIETVDRDLAIDIELFSRGGEEILNAIERQGYDVLRRRPVISKTRKLELVARAASRKLLRNAK